ncbi:MAG TPA: pyridoxal-phosphate dependent enzyme, partial [Phenylobacterium sp.]
AVVAPCSGGGLLAGIATAVKALSPATALIGAEPAGYDDTLTSLRAGVRTPVTPTRRTLCDALESPCTGELTFPILQRFAADIAVVTDAEVAEAMRVAFSTLKLVVEPGGAAGLAALLAGKLTTPTDTVAVVLSGGNVDPEPFAAILRREL